VLRRHRGVGAGASAPGMGAGVAVLPPRVAETTHLWLNVRFRGLWSAPGVGAGCRRRVSAPGVGAGCRRRVSAPGVGAGCRRLLDLGMVG